ncbi:hypothetical protein HR060_17245 [Catenovulum sp. SM1970]|uniref:hypothetical protein n=1 Tax=Marinifaba aquimaris TaxID=2741323 RepID=UPI0015739420|nr:hypothetical protein [Marinifaba aquimaris]NTS78592.1 hypothetical protein [Marinifaba aquimaris]
MIKIRPQTIHKHPALQVLMWLGFALPFVMIVLGGMGLVGNWFMMITGFWGLTLAALLLLWANNNGVKNAFKTRQISQADYAHWNKRTYCGLGLFAIACLYVTFTIGQKVIVKKENLTITAVPTPELMAQMKQFLNEPDVTHTKVEFNGQEQEITFFTQTRDVATNIDRMLESNHPFPTFKTLQGENVDVIYTSPPQNKAVKIGDTSYCVRARKIKQHYDKITPIIDNFEFVHKISTWAYKNEIFISRGRYVYYSNSVDRCRIKDLSSKLEKAQKAQFYPFIEYHFDKPHLSTDITMLSREKRIGFRSWKSLNEL